MASILIIGESSFLSYLSCVLSRAGWDVTFLPYTDKNFNHKKHDWQLFTPDTKIKFRPTKVLFNLVELSSLLDQRHQYSFSFDYIVFTQKFVKFLENAPSLFEKVLHQTSIVLYEPTEDSPLDDKVGGLFPLHCTQMVLSDADCRLIDSNTYQLMHTEFLLKIAPVAFVPNPATEGCFRKRRSGATYKSLVKFIHTLKMEKVRVTKFRHRVELHASQWSHILNLVPLQMLSIIFERSDFSYLIENETSRPLLDGIFWDMQQLIKHHMSQCQQEYKCDTILDLLTTEDKMYQERLLLIQKNPHLPPEIVHNKLLYDYKKGYEVHLECLLRNLLQAAKKFNINVCHLKFASSSLEKLLAIKNGIDTQGQFYWPQFSNEKVFKENVMLFMARHDNEDDNHSIDSQLQDLVAGTEGYNYDNEIFYDADRVKAPLTAIEPIIADQLLVLKRPSPPIQPPPPQQQLAANITSSEQTPATLTMVKDAQGNLYLVQPNGTAIMVTPFMQDNKPVPLTPGPKSFHHEAPTTRYTSVQSLRDSHADLLEMLHYDRLMDQNTSTRYGAYDTSTHILNSANNSLKSSDKSSRKSNPKS